MTEVILTEEAQSDLQGLVRSHSLPPDTGARLRRSLQLLRTFPEAGAQLEGRWQGYRFLLGPWRWMLVIYRFDPREQIVYVLRIYDGRSATAG